MTLKLYHHPPSRSVRVLWALRELDLDAEVVTAPMNHAALKEPEFRTLNPLGKTPVFFDGDKRIIESNAINEYLARKYGQGKLTRSEADDDFAEYLLWLHFGEAGMGGYVNQLVAQTALLPEKDRNPARKAWAEREVKNCLDFLEAHLGDDGYLVDDFTLADISVGYLLFLLKITKNGQLLGHKTNGYFKRLAEREAWKLASAPA